MIHLEKLPKHWCVLTPILLLLWIQLGSGICAKILTKHTGYN
jgi:hypothetical protein